VCAKWNYIFFIGWKKEKFPNRWGLPQWNAPILLSKLYLKNVMKIFMFAVKHVRQNHMDLSQVQGTKPNGQFRGETTWPEEKPLNNNFRIVIPLCLSNLYRLRSSSNTTLKISSIRYIYCNMFQPLIYGHHHVVLNFVQGPVFKEESSLLHALNIIFWCLVYYAK